MKEYLKKHHLFFSLGFFVLLFLAGTLIFNSFWSGKPFPSWATEHNDIKDYATVYISLLSFLGTIYAASLVIYAYDGWKEQHNTQLETDYKKDILRVTRKIAPLENKYSTILSSYQLYQGDETKTLPISIKIEEVYKLVELSNELICMLQELYLISSDIRFKRLKDHYFQYAQDYPTLLSFLHHWIKQEDAAERKRVILETLEQKIEITYIDINNDDSVDKSINAHLIKGLQQTQIIKFISESLKI